MSTRIVTDALIIRENNNIGEADRFVTLLSREHGILRASARGAQKAKSRNASATRMLCYSRLHMVEGKSSYVITEARPIHTFFELHNELEKLSLAQYFCELAGVLAPRGEPAEEQLRLLLNALHYLCNGQRSRPVLKAVVELRLLKGAGYAPDLSACTRCRTDQSDLSGPEGASLGLLLQEGVLAHRQCIGPATGNAHWVPLPPDVLAAMRHIVYGDFAKIFAFALPEQRAALLAQVSEQFLLTQTGRSYRTLEFYRSLSSL